MKKLFFGYLPNNLRLITRISFIIISVYLPFWFYKQDEGVLIEDVLAKLIYSFESVDIVLISTGPTCTIIVSILLYKLIHNKNELSE